MAAGGAASRTESGSWRRTIAVVLRPASLSFLALLFASSVAAYTAFHLEVNLSFSCSGPPTRGENIIHAQAVVFFGGIVTSILVLLARKRRRLLLAVLLFGLAILSVAVYFVRLDSATYVQENASCGLSQLFGMTKGSERGTAGYLYVCWGIALGILLVQAARVMTGRRRSLNR